jgi:hypothetical protein
MNKQIRIKTSRISFQSLTLLVLPVLIFSTHTFAQMRGRHNNVIVRESEQAKPTPLSAQEQVQLLNQMLNGALALNPDEDMDAFEKAQTAAREILPRTNPRLLTNVKIDQITLDLYQILKLSARMNLNIDRETGIPTSEAMSRIPLSDIEYLKSINWNGSDNTYFIYLNHILPAFSNVVNMILKAQSPQGYEEIALKAWLDMATSIEGILGEKDPIRKILNETLTILGDANYFNSNQLRTANSNFPIIIAVAGLNPKAMDKNLIRKFKERTHNAILKADSCSVIFEEAVPLR